MTERERKATEAWAKGAKPSELFAATKGANRERAAIAQRELTRRENEQPGSLTGVVEPL